MSKGGNTDPLQEVAPLRIAVEALSNIHYLIRLSSDDSDAVKQLLELAEPAMVILRIAAHPRISPLTVFGHPQSSKGDDYGDPLPLADAGEGEKSSSGGIASPEPRGDRLEAD